MLSKLESVLMPLAEKIGKNKYLIAVRDGFLLSMPLLIVGSFFLERFLGAVLRRGLGQLLRKTHGRHLLHHGDPGRGRNRILLCGADERG